MLLLERALISSNQQSNKEKNCRQTLNCTATESDEVTENMHSDRDNTACREKTKSCQKPEDVLRCTHCWCLVFPAGEAAVKGVKGWYACWNHLLSCQEMPVFSVLLWFWHLIDTMEDRFPLWSDYAARRRDTKEFHTRTGR